MYRHKYGPWAAACAYFDVYSSTLFANEKTCLCRSCKYRGKKWTLTTKLFLKFVLRFFYSFSSARFFYPHDSQVVLSIQNSCIVENKRRIVSPYLIPRQGLRWLPHKWVDASFSSLLTYESSFLQTKTKSKIQESDRDWLYNMELVTVIENNSPEQGLIAMRWFYHCVVPPCDKKNRFFLFYTLQQRMPLEIAFDWGYLYVLHDLYQSSMRTWVEQHRSIKCTQAAISEASQT